MEQGTPEFPSESIGQDHASTWAQEVRSYLLGRIAKDRRLEPLEDSQTARLEHPPVLRWWIFEGKAYPGLHAPLAESLGQVVHQAKRLLATFNPRLRLSDRPDGEVDWAQTLARGLCQVHSEYVVRSSGVGLDENERTALYGWIGWIKQEWSKYAEYLGKQFHIEWSGFAANAEAPLHLDRWAHIAKRSRWPLLHGIVAESIRPVLEPAELDRIPLPSDEAKLFELVCLVRVARCLAPWPRELRWLTSETNNEIRIDTVRIYYQQSLEREAVLQTYGESGLALAIDKFGVGTPKFVDLAFAFDLPRAGFDGIIIEAKSGTQEYRDTVSQLRAYQTARPRALGSRYLVWGIVREGSDAKPDDLQEWFVTADQSEDVWVFSSPDGIPAVLAAAGMSVKTRETGRESELAPVAEFGLFDHLNTTANCAKSRKFLPSCLSSSG